MELRLCVGARTSRIGDHKWSRRSYVCTACPALLEPRTLMLVMTNRVSQARTFRLSQAPMIQRYDHTARAQGSTERERSASKYHQLALHKSKRLDTPSSLPRTPGAKATIVCLVLIWTHPEAELLRSAIRSTQPALTNTTGVIPCGGHELRVICRFALGAPHGAQRQARLFAEQTWHRDLALLNMTEAPGLGRGRSYDGKAWRTLEWAVLNHPEATVVFKQDADSLVDYRRAVPTFLSMASRVAFQGKRIPKERPSRLSPQRYAAADVHAKSGCAPSWRPLNAYMGHHCHRSWCTGPAKVSQCASGSLYGMTSDVARWVVSHAKPERGYDEDMIVCKYVNDYEQRTGHTVSREGIWLPSSEVVAPFLHGSSLKNPEVYLRCAYDHLDGCRVNSPGHTSVVLNFQFSARTNSPWSTLPITDGMGTVSEPFEDSLVVPLPKAEPGHCGATNGVLRANEGVGGRGEGQGDCELDDMGSWWLAPEERTTWTAVWSACIARCTRCRRCHHLSASIRHADCSWYSGQHNCSQVQQKPMGFQVRRNVRNGNE